MRSPNTVDFLRGFALMEILVNHVPGNALSRFTHRQYGWSDAAETLIFLAGLALALRRERAASSLRKEWRRAWSIYVWHVIFSFVLICVYLIASMKGDAGVLAENGAAQIDVATLGGVFLLTHQLRYFDILPLYVVMALISPLILYLAQRGPAVLLFVSFCVYASARGFGLDVATWPQQGHWYFNPFAWQFLFVLGFVCGGAREAFARAARSSAWLTAALLVLAIGAIAMFFGVPDERVAARGALEAALWDKGELGPMRILHFLALAFVVARLSGPASAWIARHAPSLWGGLSVLGRYSLHTFCMAAVLSAIGQIAHRAGFHGLFFDAAFFLASLLVLLGFVWFVRARRLSAAAPTGPALGARSPAR